MAVPNSVFRPFNEKLGDTEVTEFIGNEGDLFYDPETGELRISDGVTPGGNPTGTPGNITAVTAGRELNGGGTGGNVTLNLNDDIEVGVLTVSDNVGGSLIPGDPSYNLGSAANPWNEVFVSSGSIYVGASSITEQDGALYLGEKVHIGLGTVSFEETSETLNLGTRVAIGSHNTVMGDGSINTHSIIIRNEVSSSDLEVGPPGSLIAAGFVSATTYYGDGSNLTGVTAELPADVDVTNVSASSSITGGTFFGDGSGLTNVSAAVTALGDIGDVTLTDPARHDIITYIDEQDGFINQPGPSRVIQEVRNDSGSTAYTAGAPVIGLEYNQGNERFTITGANAGIATLMPALGLVLNSINPNSNGIVVTAGVVENVDTNAFNEGDELYVNVGGGLTSIRPTGPDELVQKIATVLRSGNNGSLIVQGAGRTNAVPNKIETNFIDGVSAGSTISIGTEVGLTDEIVIGAAGGTGNKVTINSDLLESNTAANFNNVSVVAGFYGNSLTANEGSLNISASAPDSELNIAGGISLSAAAGITSIPGGTIILTAGDSASSSGDNELTGGAGQVNIRSGDGKDEFSGGDINITAGIGSTDSSGGSVTISGGEATPGGRFGGALILSAGDADTATAGNASLRGGDATSDSISDAAGNVTILGGSHSQASDGRAVGGDVNIRGGGSPGSGDVDGGDVNISGGIPLGGDGDGGNVEITGGYTVNPNATAGDVEIKGGYCLGGSNNTAGIVTISGGDINLVSAAPNSIAGDVAIRGGGGTQATTAGNVYIVGGEGDVVTQVGGVAIQGGESRTGNDGGTVIVQGGLCTTTANSGNGGSVQITGGNRSGTDANVVNAGNIIITGGTREGSGINSVRGGDISIVGGEGTGNALGGDVTIRAGTGEELCGKLTLAGGNGGLGGNTSPGGDCEVFGGLAGGDNQTAGQLLLKGGTAAGNNSVAADVVIQGGDAIAGTSTCGNVLINGGDKSSDTDIEGHVTLQNIYRFEPLSGETDAQETKFFFRGTLSGGATDTIVVGDQATYGTLKIDYQASRGTGTPNGRALGQTLIAHYGTDVQTQLQGVVNSNGSLPSLVTVSGAVSGNDLQITVKHEVTEDVNYKLFVTAYSI